MKFKVNIKLCFFLAALVFLVLAIISIGSTYARYVTSLTARSYIDLGRWLIKVNDQNIIQTPDLSGVITPVFTNSIEGSEEQYIAEGKIAPTSTGYVLIKLDYQDVTVPFEYDISFEHDESTIMEDFKLISYSIDDGEEIAIDETVTSVKGTVSPSETTRIRNLKLNLEWYDGTGEQSNDIQDTLFSANDEMGLRFNLHFNQLTTIPEQATGAGT